MPRNSFMRAALIAAAGLVWSCSEGSDSAQDASTAQPTDTGVALPTAPLDGATATPDASLLGDASGSSADAMTPADAEALKSCLDRPGELSPPTSGALPCELVPPGLAL